MSGELSFIRTVPIEPVRVRETPIYRGVLFFLISEAFLFGSLFWAFFYLEANSPVWPPAGIHLNTGLAIISTAILVSSSGTIWWAVRGIREGRERVLSAGITATLLLGSAFLGITVWEWVHESFRPWSHAYGSIFFTLTGFHALHVFLGVLFLSSLLVRSLRRRFSARNYLAVEAGSLYWHFVDVVWLAVFSSIFIIG